MTRRRRRNNNESGGGSGQERWLVTYADMITLLLIFFIVMYSISQVDAEKFQDLAYSLANAMGAGGMIMESPGPSVVPGQGETGRGTGEQEELENIQQQLQEFINERGLNAEVSASVEQRGIVLTFQEDVLFDLGSARLREDARNIINEVTPILKKTDNYLRVEGHTDDLPINTQRFPSNWELSASRATNVLQQLVDAGISADRLSALAYGEHRPRVPNNSPENRQLNRRVNIILLRTKYEGSEPGAPGESEMPSVEDESGVFEDMEQQPTN